MNVYTKKKLKKKYVEKPSNIISNANLCKNFDR